MRTASPFLLALAMAVATTIPAAAQSTDRPIAESVDMSTADFGTYPENYEELIKSWATTALKDPESVRWGRMSKPRREWMVVNLKPFFGYSVCADINAKNSYGGYTGTQTFWFLIRDGKIARSQSTSGFPGKMISREHFVNCEDGAPQ